MAVWNLEANDIFLHAVEKTAAERGAYLVQACGDNAELRAQVEALLAASAKVGSFLEHPAVDPNDTKAYTPPSAPGETGEHVPQEVQPGTIIADRYKLLEQIGEGGMGTVWMAQQTAPVKRHVALKLVKAGMDSRAVLARFEAERQALALMDHPNIAKVLDAGTIEIGWTGRPFFVMELVKGIPITKFCDDRKLTTRERLALFIPVCQAIQHAHQKGIIHRDIKPSNVLVALYDDKPVPKVIDFGVAKAIGQPLTEQSLHTGFGQVVGTFEYMSPEQASFNQLDVDTRSDIYSLGVVLYELLAGSPPFSRKELEKAGVLEMLRVIREQEPSKPSVKLSSTAGLPNLASQRGTEPAKLKKLVRGELDWIVMKALEKERTRRYETANGSAMDIQRYLADQPVQAFPPSAGYRFRKFAGRHRVAMGTAALIALILVAAIFLLTLSNVQIHQEKRHKEEALLVAQRNEDTANRQREEANHRLFRALLAEARNGRLSNGLGRRLRSLEVLDEATLLARELKLPEKDFLELRNETIACLPLTDLRVAKEWPGYLAGTLFVDFDANLERYVRVGLDGKASIRRVADDAEICHVPVHTPRHAYPVLSFDGQFLALHQLPRGIKVWKVNNGLPVLLCNEPESYGFADFSTDSREVALSWSNGIVRILELPSGRMVRELTTAKNPEFKTFNPAKRQLAVQHSEGITVFDLDSGNQLVALPGPSYDEICWGPEGETLASHGRDHLITLWNVPSCKRIAQFVGHTNGRVRTAFHSASDLFASCAWDNRLFLWDPRTSQQLLRIPWDAQGTMQLRFGQRNDLLAADVTGHQLRLWEVLHPVGYRTLVRDPLLGKAEYYSCAFNPKHHLLACSMSDGISFFEYPSGRFLTHLKNAWKNVVVFEPTGSLLGNSSAGQARWRIEEGTKPGELRVRSPKLTPFPRSIFQIAMSADGQVIASAQGWGALVRRSDFGERMLRLFPHPGAWFIAVSPNGDWIVTGCHGSTDVYVKVWNGRTGAHVTDLPVEGSSPLGFSPDGRWLATMGDHCRLWSVGSWREGPTIAGREFAFSPDSRILAVESGLGMIRLIDPDTGREYARLEDPHHDRAGHLAFSPDGTQLAVTTTDSPAIHLWDLRTIRAELAKRNLDWDLPPFPPNDAQADTPPLQVTVD